ncbi:MAG: DPP IV N-terminal domain-containing protein, partial [Gemmatimonadota bacterium]
MIGISCQPTVEPTCRPAALPSCRLGLLFAALWLPTPAAAQPDYHRADQIRMATTRVQNVPDWYNIFGFGDPTWLEDSTRFWYRVPTGRGADFILVDPVRALRRPVFDNARLASAMSVAGDTAFDGTKLPFRTFEFVGGDQRVAVRVGKKRYECDLGQYRCVKGDTLTTETPAWAIGSPNKQWEAYNYKYNIWIRPKGGASKDSIQLTTDGVKDFEYGLDAPSDPTADSTARRRPALVWSPDSKRLAVERIDERRVRRYAVYSSTGQHPKIFLYPVATPGDSIVPMTDIHVLDVDGRSNVRIQHAPQLASSFGWTGFDQMQWSARSDRVYFITPSRANKKAELSWAEPASGLTHPVLAESLSTFTENASGVFTGNWRVSGDGNEVIWWSERDGWGHLYRYDATGHLINQVTSGPWLVDRVKHVDPVAKQIYFLALGRQPEQPYYAHLMRVNFDGTGLTDLTPEPGHHMVSFVPTGKFFVDGLSRTDLGPVTSLRSALDGRKVLDLEKADLNDLSQIGWTPARPFVVKARDGVTDLYGFMYLPSQLDTTKKYPVIDHIYPGPQVGSIVQYGFGTGGEPRALAELGFVVIEVNAMGTPGRSKAFHDAYFGNMGDNGLPDHIATIKQLAARHRFIDLDRVGIYGHSGGGFASTDAILRYPDFFKVAVSGSGNHDNRSYIYDWGEKYQGQLKRDSLTGKDNYESQANYLMAGNLKGKLLLMTGDIDTNVHPTMTFRLVDALIKAEKDFDMLVIPDAQHGLPDYSIKRRWDYFVRWL